MRAGSHLPRWRWVGYSGHRRRRAEGLASTKCQGW